MKRILFVASETVWVNLQRGRYAQKQGQGALQRAYSGLRFRTRDFELASTGDELVRLLASPRDFDILFIGKDYFRVMESVLQDFAPCYTPVAHTCIACIQVPKSPSQQMHAVL
ncbi:hypothetical protein GF380_03620 [Candidatus Uhrbacteria bacterium]|nr:hypothetical protein [Candidatus Uhrbacteria bacterium]MBD3284205.1 hypothetical protein [Candidatus Uhrbacteria bacterium]